MSHVTERGWGARTTRRSMGQPASKEQLTRLGDRGGTGSAHLTLFQRRRGASPRRAGNPRNLSDTGNTANSARYGQYSPDVGHVSL